MSTIMAEEEQIQVFTSPHLNGGGHGLCSQFDICLSHTSPDSTPVLFSQRCDGGRNVGNVEKRSGGVLGSPPILTPVHTWQLKCQVKKAERERGPRLAAEEQDNLH
ncbi:hypothetical protein GBF38_019680 [Nibea albiflora]|uniref:Uncharacterized protein n=1 Tax=Nibea albiflora TaxID=240163 RepID=A0ACB7F1Z1_NIBAL|nr:hypothetical protein GBF38_019680 [Nibea albiflora]